jgi:hypothetical protein
MHFIDIYHLLDISIIDFSLNIKMKKNPISITILLMFVLFFMLLQGMRIYAILLNWNILINYNFHPGPEYLIITSITWFVIGLWLAIYIIRRNTKTSLFVYLTSGIYIIWFWVDRIYFQHRVNALLFPIIGTCLMLLFIIHLLTRQDSKIYFQRTG